MTIIETPLWWDIFKYDSFGKVMNRAQYNKFLVPREHALISFEMGIF